MADHKSPDYTDENWSELIRDRTKKWKAMMQALLEEGLNPIDIWGDNVPNNTHPDGFRPQLVIWPVHRGEKKGTIIICAGGGFLFKSSNEAKPVAEYFHKRGFNAAILDYYTNPAAKLGAMETQLHARGDGLRAIRYLRYHAKKLGIRPDKIAIGGFSAGGMLSNMAATGYDNGKAKAADPVEQVSSRPDAVLLFYGASAPASENGFMLGYDAEKQKTIAALSPEKNIKSDSPPYFMFQTYSDNTHGMITMASELSQRGVPFVMHTFMDGPHGGGLYDGACEDSPSFPHTAKWAELATDWLEDLDF